MGSEYKCVFLQLTSKFAMLKDLVRAMIDGWAISSLHQNHSKS